MKKVMLMVVAAVLLVGMTVLAQEEREGRPGERERRKEVVREGQRERVRAEQGLEEREEEREGVREREGRELARGEAPELRREKEGKKPKASKLPMPKAGAPMKGFGGGMGPAQRPWVGRPGAGRMLSGWLDELTNAYRENDREKMGLLIRQMHQLRQRMSASTRLSSSKSGGLGPGGRGLGRGWRGSAGPGMGMGRGMRGGGWGGWQDGMDQGPPADREKWQRDFGPEGMDMPETPMLPEGPVPGRGIRGPMREGSAGPPEMRRRGPGMAPPSEELEDAPRPPEMRRRGRGMPLPEDREGGPPEF
jgi:hypothetical protein